MKRIILGTLTLLLAQSAFAQNMGIDNIFNNLQSTTQDLIVIFGQWVSYIIGLSLTIKGCFKLVEKTRNPNIGINVPISYFVIGTCLFWLGSSVEVLNQTLFGSASADASFLMPSAVQGSATIASAKKGLMTFVAFVGLVSIIRGLMMLQSGLEGKNGMLGRATTHIIGGAIAWNIPIFASMVATTLGFR